MGNSKSKDESNAEPEIEGEETKEPEFVEVEFPKKFSLELEPYNDLTKSGAIVVGHFGERSKRKVPLGSRIVEINGKNVESISFRNIHRIHLREAKFPCTIKFKLLGVDFAANQRDVNKFEDVDRRAFAEFLMSMRQPVLQKFWDKYDFDKSQDLNSHEFKALLHAAICLYFRKINEDTRLELPKRSQTSRIVREITEIIFQRARGEVLMRKELDKVGKWLIEYYERADEHSLQAVRRAGGNKTWTLEQLWNMCDEIMGPLPRKQRPYDKFFPKIPKVEAPSERVIQDYMIAFAIWFDQWDPREKQDAWLKKVQSVDDFIDDRRINTLMYDVVKKHFADCGEAFPSDGKIFKPIVLRLTNNWRRDRIFTGDMNGYFTHFNNFGKSLMKASAKLIFEHSQAELGNFMVDDLNVKDLKSIWKQFDHDEDGDIARGKLEPLIIVLNMLYGRNQKRQPPRPLSLIRQGKISKMKINQVRETIVKHLKDSDFLTKGEFMEIPEWLQHTERTAPRPGLDSNRHSGTPQGKTSRHDSSSRRTTMRKTVTAGGGDPEKETPMKKKKLKKKDLDELPQDFWTKVNLGPDVNIDDFRKWVGDKKKHMWKYFSKKWTDGKSIKTSQIPALLHNFVVVYCHNVSKPTPPEETITLFTDAWRSKVNEDILHGEGEENTDELTRNGFETICNLLNDPDLLE